VSTTIGRIHFEYADTPNQDAITRTINANRRIVKIHESSVSSWILSGALASDPSD
jgi:hypothetical protein